MVAKRDSEYLRQSGRSPLSSETLRLFISYALEPALIEWLEQAIGDISGITWHAPDRLHVTICFIGEVPSSQMKAVADMLSAVDAAPCELVIAGTQRVRIAGSSDLICARLSPSAPLKELHAKIRHGLAALGLAVRHGEFWPHITLGVIRSALPACDEWLAYHREFSGPSFVIDRIGLYSSLTDFRGGNHQLLSQKRLINMNGSA